MSSLTRQPLLLSYSYTSYYVTAAQRASAHPVFEVSYPGYVEYIIYVQTNSRANSHFVHKLTTTPTTAINIATWDDLKCGICLELFQDPRSLPYLHTFCRECIQRSLNEENHSLKCPVCRAKHELSEGGATACALQEPPLKRLQQQREDNGGPHQLVEC